MNRLMNAATVYGVLALVGGVFYREFTKINGFTTLSVVRGVIQVLGLNVSSAAISGIAGIGHLILGVSMVLVLISIRKCIKD